MPKDLPLDRQSRDTLRRFQSFTEALRHVDNDMPVVQASILLQIALNEGTTQREITNTLRLASSTASRSVASLSEVHRLGKPGLGLITWYEDPTDRRSKRLVLTRKGRVFVDRLTEA